jgi:hypothetical protein
MILPVQPRMLLLLNWKNHNAEIGTSLIGDHLPEYNSLLTRLVAWRQNHSYIGVPADPVNQLHIRAEETPPFVILLRGGNKMYHASNWPLTLLSIVLAVSLLLTQSPARTRNIRLPPRGLSCRNQKHSRDVGTGA